MVIGKVRKVFLTTVKRDVFNKIIKDLKTNFFFNFGHGKYMCCAIEHNLRKIKVCTYNKS